MINSYSQNTATDDRQGLLFCDESLQNGIWPRSVPLWMAAFYVALFIIRPWEELFPWLGAIHFERVYAIGMIAAVLFSQKTRFQMTSQSISVIFFLMGLFLSALLAVNPSLATDSFYSYLSLVVFYFILIMVIRSPYDLVFMVVCYIFAMAVYLAKSQWEFFVHGQHRYTMGVVRMVGIESTFGGPNSLAMSIVVSLPMALLLWTFRKEISANWPPFWHKWFPRFIIIYFGIAISSIILTNSRSGFVSLILFVTLVGFKGKGIGKKLLYLLIGALIVIVAWQFIPEENKGRFRTIWAPEAGPNSAQSSADGRIEGFRAGMTMFDRFPITGVGIGNFIGYRVHHVDGVPLQAHNLYGQVLGETGLIGGVTFLMMVMITLKNCRKIKVQSNNHLDPTLSILSGLAIACRNSIVLLAFTGLFGHNLLRFNWLWLAAFSALALQFSSQYTKVKTSNL